MRLVLSILAAAILIAVALGVPLGLAAYLSRPARTVILRAVDQGG